MFVRKIYGTTDPSEGVPLFSTHLPLYRKYRILPLPINSAPLEELECKVDRRDTTTPAPRWLRPIAAFPMR